MRVATRESLEQSAYPERVKVGDHLWARDAYGGWLDMVAESEIETAGPPKRHDFAGVFVRRASALAGDPIFWPLEDLRARASDERKDWAMSGMMGNSQTHWCDCTAKGEMDFKRHDVACPWRKARAGVRVDDPPTEVVDIDSDSEGAASRVSPAICGVICAAGKLGEPLACAWQPDHDGPHSWASLPTFGGADA